MELEPDEDHAVHTSTVREGGKITALRRRLLEIAVKKGPDKGYKERFSNDRIVIGSHASCDVVLHDPTVSRHHLEVVLSARGYTIRDLDTTNGSYLDRVRLSEIRVTEAVSLRIGQSQVSIAPLSDTVDIALAAPVRFGPLLGRSVAMRRVFDVLARFAATDITVLVTGESGTGKELAAEALHQESARKDGPFRVVDCSALSGNLIESELFGHVKGAFTGADRARDGMFVAASGGTLFLDEIGELPRELQSRLLGAIERRRVQPVGSSQSVPVDVRIVAATNRDLRREVNRGNFREDLYFRLAVGLVEMPPLRERPEDIGLYVEQLAGPGRIEPEQIKQLEKEHWPGNVRQLRNRLEQTLALGESLPPDEQRRDHPTFSVEIDAEVPYKVAKAQLIETYDRAYLTELLRRAKSNITHAAKTAQLDRVYFLRMLDRFGMRPGRS